MSARNTKRFQINGWILFILSAVLFTWTTAMAGDWIGMAASLLFLAACFVFLIPVLGETVDSDEGDNR